MMTIDELNNILSNTNATDFTIWNYDGRDLLIVGSFDFTYYHQIEIRFVGVSYISLPTDFRYPTFYQVERLEEMALNHVTSREAEDKIYGIKAETTSSVEPVQFYIIAQGIEVKEGMVYYYDRKDLKENERLADWVLKSKKV